MPGQSKSYAVSRQGGEKRLRPARAASARYGDYAADEREEYRERISQAVLDIACRRFTGKYKVQNALKANGLRNSQEMTLRRAMGKVSRAPPWQRP